MATPVPTRQTSGRLTHLAGKTTEVAQSTYTTAKNVLVPEKMKPTVDNVESQVAGAAAPYVHKAQDAGEGVGWDEQNGRGAPLPPLPAYCHRLCRGAAGAPPPPAVGLSAPSLPTVLRSACMISLQLLPPVTPHLPEAASSRSTSSPAAPCRLPHPSPRSLAGASLLRAADDKVDRAVETAQRVYTDNAAYLEQQLAKQKEFHSQNLESFKTAREAYLHKVGRVGGGTTQGWWRRVVAGGSGAVGRG